MMGSKNIKAIVVKGSRGTFVRDKEATFALLKEIRDLLDSDPWFRMFSHAGTTGLTENYNGLGVMPIRNFQEGALKEIGSLSSREFLRHFAKKLWGTESAADRFAHLEKGKLVRWCEDMRVL